MPTKAEVINAFCISWNDLPFYCFPPFSCIGKVLQKIISSNATGILIFPNCPCQFWFTVLQDLVLTDAIIRPPNGNNLYLPNQLDLKHPFFKEARTDSVSGVRKSFGKQFNLSSGVSDLIMKSWSVGTAKRYASHLRRWFSFVSENGLQPLNADVANDA